MSDEAQRVAVVTGGARGIGAAASRRLAADGLAVAVLDLKEGDCGATVDAITAAGGKALAVGGGLSGRPGLRGTQTFTDWVTEQRARGTL